MLSWNLDGSGEILKLKACLRRTWRNDTDTPTLYALSPIRYGGTSFAHMARKEEEEERTRKKIAFLLETEENTESWRTDWLLGQAFCHMNTPPSPASKPCHLSPQCEGHPDRQPRKPGLQTVTTLISPDKSLARLTRPSPLLPLQNVKYTEELKDLPGGAAQTSFACNKQKDE